jgi:hypothetical protein
MRGIEERYETPKWRMLWLVISFTILVGIGVVTVLLPELKDEPEDAQSVEVEQPSSDEATSE